MAVLQQKNEIIGRSDIKRNLPSSLPRGRTRGGAFFPTLHVLRKPCGSIIFARIIANYQEISYLCNILTIIENNERFYYEQGKQTDTL